MNAMTKTTYAATAPDGSQHTRTSHRSYTHAVLLEGDEGWGAVGFCGRADLAQKKQGEHPGSIVVECDVLDAEPTDDAVPEATEDETATDERTWTSAADGVPGPEAEQPVEPKPTISALVKRLLMDETLDYASIVERVVAEFPDAKTTARSVASVAAVMRKHGHQVPMRRKPRKGGKD